MTLVEAPSPAGKVVTAAITVTSFHHGIGGGGILIGRDEDNALRRAIVPAFLAARPPEPGETWRVTGPETLHKEYGDQIAARVALPLRPSGRAIIRYLATNRRFEGVGWATATRLWEQLGSDLYRAIGERDFAPIAGIAGPQRAIAIIDGFGLLSEEIEVFQWLDRYGVAPRTAAAVAALWGKQAIDKLSADPYSLALLEPWTVVDQRAMRLGLLPDDERRLLAAVDEAFARRYRLGHTAATEEEVMVEIRALLGAEARHVASGSIVKAVQSGRVVALENGLYQSRAIHFIEREIERLLQERLRRDVPAISPQIVDAAILDVESAAGLTLTDRQRDSVYMATSTSVCVVHGGAGTGKTSTVKAILAATNLGRGSSRGYKCALVALAGRAAKRMREATGADAMTVARFLRQLETSKQPWLSGLLILDEASMLDLPSVFRILVALPPSVDILFLGDPGQLPPIGPGLVFHRMIGATAIPQVCLDTIHRQAAQTGIPVVAAAVRNGTVPDLPLFDRAAPERSGVFLAPTSTEFLNDAVLQVFAAMAGRPPPALQMGLLHERDIQILSATKRGPGGSASLNEEIERIYMANQPKIDGWGLSIGSKVIWLRNDYKKAPMIGADGQPLRDSMGEVVYSGFMNGALGTIEGSSSRGASVLFDDGASDEIGAYDLEKLTHGWSISVHKAQGSAFRRVIIPIAKSRLLDRSLIYTAITRGIETVVLVGERSLIEAAVSAPPKAIKRCTTLSFDGFE
jgi:exodeoxyribonuclease V alpha subunit